MRLGIFSYTIPASRDSDPGIRAELRLLDTSLSRAEFARTLGDLVRAPTKPWWKFW